LLNKYSKSPASSVTCMGKMTETRPDPHDS
jgi:hypothetical protein